MHIFRIFFAMILSYEVTEELIRFKKYRSSKIRLSLFRVYTLSLALFDWNLYYFVLTDLVSNLMQFLIL
ncbi:hypothetical protein GQ55_8G127900 [Panicum hallii var. hallii]|jgi:hypothetical protein|uniref:Uncharacterized protein n=1 Tax=Panicum hallii var. hallii TaxID=1504633 RepID=A0A2T7CMY6_9POAL|nr:hypothetical protein GQ55_8G127900 [Panicum hallii var. hallii]